MSSYRIHGSGSRGACYPETAPRPWDIHRLQEDKTDGLTPCLLVDFKQGNTVIPRGGRQDIPAVKGNIQCACRNSLYLKFVGCRYGLYMVKIRNIFLLVIMININTVFISLIIYKNCPSSENLRCLGAESMSHRMISTCLSTPLSWSRR